MQQNKIITDIKKLLDLYNEGSVFCAFDTETTGLNSSLDHVVEIGAVRFNKDGVIDTYNELINPCCVMPYQATIVNNITNEMLKDCPIINQVLPDFMKFIDGTILVAHNVGFDLKFVNKELSRCGLNTMKNYATDTLKLSKTIFPSLPSHKLQDLAVSFNIKALQAHRAQDDARVCMEVFLKCLKDAFNGNY